MRLPSVERLVTAAGAASHRFPAVLACGALAALAASIQIDTPEPWLRLMLAASLGLPAFTAITLFAERRRLSAGATWSLHAVGGVLLALFYWRWSFWGEPNAVLRYFHASATLHLAVAVLPYLGVREPTGFWQFNRALFLRFLIGGVYSAVLFAGLALALAGIDNLLGVDVAELTYFRLFVTIAFVFQTWFVLAGVPYDFEALERSRDYPAGLRVFAQYVLLPLVMLYLVILTAYLGRVVLTRTWPSGWIGYLVSALAALGILSLLLVHPERGRPEQRWIDRYARTFWVAILPAVIMLLLAVWKRIEQYGVTERRYLLTALALWLAATATYYAITRARGIKGIPLSLTLLGIATFFGPWSAYAVSERSQIARLRQHLEAHALLTEGRAVAAATGEASPGREIPPDDWQQISDGLAYLIRHHGTAGIDPWFDGGLAAIDTIAGDTGPSNDAVRRGALIVQHLGLEPSGGLPATSDGLRHYAVRSAERVIPTAGFDHAVFGIDLLSGRYVVGGDTIELAARGDAIVLSRNGAPWLEASLDPILARGLGGGLVSGQGRLTLPRDSLRVDATAQGSAARVYIDHLTVRSGEGGIALERATGTLLLRSAGPGG